MTPKALSRHPKYRVWDTANKKMYSVDELHNLWSIGIPVAIHQKESGAEIRLRCDKNPLMEATGLHDKNGKEIYEGDVIKVLDRDWGDAEKDTRILIVYYREDRYILINKAGIEESEKSEPNIYNQEWYEVSLFREYGRDRFEIIGNIYENPELLN